MDPTLEPTLYELLGVPENATPSQIRTAWREKAVLFHPDHVGESGGDVFISVREAYETLSNPQRRRVYDAERRQGARPAYREVFTQPPAPTPPPPPPVYTRPHAEQEYGSRGGDLHTSVMIPFVDAVFGATPEATGIRRALCRSCGGYPPPPGCVVCGYSGYEPLSFSVPVEVPAGTVNGETITVLDYGDVGERPERDGELYGVPGLPGNLLVRVDVHHEVGVVAVGADLVYDTPVDVVDALLGARQRIQLLDGPATVIIPPGCAPGQRIHISGRGVPLPGTTRGDGIAEVRVIMRDNLSADERTKLESMRYKRSQRPVNSTE
jgi:molecular chaperone DnaJ